MEIFLGLGSNEGDRIAHLRAALETLERAGLTIGRVSPVVESPALLPAEAKPDWNRPYLNLALRAETDRKPGELLTLVKDIETRLGRVPSPRWSPRPIDIDILLYGRELVVEGDLQIPHPGIHDRPFVLTPLIALDPGLTLPGRGDRSVLDFSLALEHHIPLWMGIVNITPDSFSDGGLWTQWHDVEPRIEAFDSAGAQIVDLGAESTRPGARPLTDEEEWSRLAPVLEPLVDKYAGAWIRPRISVDTYHPETARRALECGIDIVNDVSGLTSPQMLELAAGGEAEWVAMHALSLPADPQKTLPPDVDAVEAVERWLLEQSERWQRAGLDLDKLYFDPGIGFGKTPLQSLEILRQAGRLRRHGLRTLIGHSRKSFMRSFTEKASHERDLQTIGASMHLVGQGVDILRVHDPISHIAAYQGWSQLVDDVVAEERP